MLLSLLAAPSPAAGFDVATLLRSAASAATAVRSSAAATLDGAIKAMAGPASSDTSAAAAARPVQQRPPRRAAAFGGGVAALINQLFASPASAPRGGGAKPRTPRGGVLLGNSSGDGGVRMKAHPALFEEGDKVLITWEGVATPTPNDYIIMTCGLWAGTTADYLQRLVSAPRAQETGGSPSQRGGEGGGSCGACLHGPHRGCLGDCEHDAPPSSVPRTSWATGNRAPACSSSATSATALGPSA